MLNFWHNNHWIRQLQDILSVNTFFYRCLLRLHRNGGISTSVAKLILTFLFSIITFMGKCWNFLDWQHFQATFGHIFTVHVQKCIFLNFTSSIGHTMQFGDPDFLKESDISLIKIHFLVVLTTFSLHMRRSGSIFTSFWSLLPPFLAASISYNRTEILARWQHFEQFDGPYFTVCAQKPLFVCFAENSDIIRSGFPVFLCIAIFGQFEEVFSLFFIG